MNVPDKFYHSLLEKVNQKSGTADKLVIGVTWTLARFEGISGLAMSPGYLTRTLPWSGELCEKPFAEIAEWILSWDGFESSIAMACINAAINKDSQILRNAISLTGQGPGNLRVFEYFLPRLIGKKVVVVGRYPGMEIIEQSCDLSVLERQPGQNDLPDPACEYVIPQADWVFLSATSIINKTFPRLAQLARHSNLVLMGPSLPWIETLSDYGVDYLAGVRVLDDERLENIVMQGGGTRIFDQAIEYCIHDFTAKHLDQTKTEIELTVKHRNRLKDEMQIWYQDARGKFPEKGRLSVLDQQLSDLDSRYKRLWDANHCNH